MLLKMGVDTSRLIPEVSKKLTSIDVIFQRNAMRGAIIKSTYGDGHPPGSLHYVNAAIDLRTRDLTAETIDEIMVELKKICPDKYYDIIYHRDHIHLEYDPK